MARPGRGLRQAGPSGGIRRWEGSSGWVSERRRESSVSLRLPVTELCTVSKQRGRLRGRNRFRKRSRLYSLQPAAPEQKEGTCGGQGRPGGTVFSSEGWRGPTPKGSQGCLQALTPSWLLALGDSAQSWRGSRPEDRQNAGLSFNRGLLQVHQALALTTAQTHSWVPPERPLGTPMPGVLP